MRQKLKSRKEDATSLDISTIVDENQGNAPLTMITYYQWWYQKRYHSKNRQSKINDIKNDISNLSNFKLDNDSRNDITHNLLNQQVKALGYHLDWISFTVNYR